MSDTDHEFIEGVRIRLEPAPVVRRTTAAAIDVGILGVGMAILFLLLMFTLGFFAVTMSVSGFADFLARQLPVASSVVIGLVFLGALLLIMAAGHFYFIYYEYKFGATPGKKLMGLRVVSVDGRRLTKGQAVYRDLVRWYIDALLFIPAFIAMACTEKRQRVGDILAGTMVVYSQAAEDKDRSLYVKREDYEALFAHLQPKPVEPSIVDAYLKFANQAFIMGQHLEVQPERATWLPKVRSLLERTETLRLNDETVLRFFAELCFQQRYEQSQGSLERSSSKSHGTIPR